MTNKEIYTIKDIAELADVSRATVDRVIHGRGKVSQKTYDKINEILEDIDFQPNIIAQTLKKGELYKIALLIPDYDFDIYWKRALLGANEAIANLSFQGIKVEQFLFNPLKEVSFKINAKQILKGEYDAVLLAPVFYNEAIDFFEKCDKIKLPYVTFNTHIKDSNPLCHIGQDLIQSGETAASLFHKTLTPDDKLLILHIEEDSSKAKHMQEKEEGFLKFYKNLGYGSEKVKVLKVGNTSEIEKPLMKLLEKNERIKGIFISTSKVYLVADIISEYGLDIKLIGYDLIDENVQHLKSGNINFLIYQNPAFQSNLGISLLVEYLAFKRELPRHKTLPIEIIIKENFNNYID